MLFSGGFLLLSGKRTRNIAFVSLCHGRSGEDICTGYAMAASGRMQYDYKQTNQRNRIRIRKLRTSLPCEKHT